MSPIKLAVEIISPLGEEDRELLSGIAVMTLAIANHELAKTKFPEAFGEDDGLSPEEPVEEPVETPVENPPAPCGMTDDQGRVCIAKAGHRGRHAMREVAPPTLPN
jgi:hypothetical protein